MNGRSSSPQIPITRDDLAPVSQTNREKAQNPKHDNKKTPRLRPDGNEYDELYRIARLSMN